MNVNLCGCEQGILEKRELTLRAPCLYKCSLKVASLQLLNIAECFFISSDSYVAQN